MIEERIVAQGHGSLSPTYFAVHSTANPGATAENHASYWSGAGADYAVHLVSDWDKCLHCVPYDRLCWQVGNGNSTCEGLEICEAETYDEFIRGLEIAKEVILERLAAHGWTVDGNVRSHKWFTENYGGSDHTDPIPYFERFGWTWEMFIEYLKEDDMQASDVWNYDIGEGVAGKNNLPAWQRLGWIHHDTSALYAELTRTDDPSGRGMECTTHEHVKWIAAKQAEMDAKLDAITTALEKLSEKES